MAATGVNQQARTTPRLSLSSMIMNTAAWDGGLGSESTGGSLRFDAVPLSGVGGTATGISITSVRCKAQGKPIVIEIDGASDSWDCEDAGLDLEPGDSHRNESDWNRRIDTIATRHLDRDRSPALVAGLFRLCREEIDRFGRSYTCDVLSFEAEQLDTTDQLTLKFRIRNFARYDLTHRHRAGRFDCQT